MSGCQNWSSDIGDYVVGPKIGKGGFGTVYQGKAKQNGVDIAIKKIEKQLSRTNKTDRIKAKERNRRIKQEIEIHLDLNHPSILKLFHYFQDDNFFYLILEFCHNGSMQNYMTDKMMVFSENDARGIMKQIVKGLVYLREKKIIHRDLSLANLLLTKSMNVKIADFGLGAQLSDLDEKHMTMCGTPNYMSPELAMKEPHGIESDVFSLGSIFYTILVGKPPFDGKDVRSTLIKVAAADYYIPSHLSREATDLMKCLLLKDPPERFKPVDILIHPFMTNDKLPGFTTSTDSGRGTISTNSSRNSSRNSPNNSRPVLDERNIRFDNQRLNSQPAVYVKNYVQRVRGIELLKPKFEPSKLNQGDILRSLKSTETDENSCSCSKSHCEHSHTKMVNSCCFSNGSEHRVWCEKVKNCSHSSPCYDANKCSHMDGCGCRKSMEHKERSMEKRKETNNRQKINDKEPLNTRRLKAMTQSVKNMNFRILESGEVCVEYMKIKNGVDIVEEECKISQDGLKMIVYTYKHGKEKTQKFAFDHIPDKHWTKYAHAKRFVDVVKAKSPKITYYSTEAKCCLMENTPNANIEVKFYDGGKIIQNSRGITINETDSTQYSIESKDGTECLSQTARKLYEHFCHCRQICLRAEKFHTQEEFEIGGTNFPVIIGRRPVLNSSSGQIQSPEEPNLGRLSAFGSGIYSEGRYLSPEISKSAKSNIERVCEIKGVGRGYLINNNDVICEYLDGSKLATDIVNGKFVYTDEKGKIMTFRKKDKDSVPNDIKNKLEHASGIVNKLLFKN